LKKRKFTCLLPRKQGNPCGFQLTTDKTEVSSEVVVSILWFELPQMKIFTKKLIVVRHYVIFLRTTRRHKPA